MEDGKTSTDTSTEIKDASKTPEFAAKNAAENVAENAAKIVSTETVDDSVMQQLVLESTIPIPIKILRRNSDEELGNKEEGEKNPPVDTTPTKKGRISTSEHPPPAKDLSPKIPRSPVSPDSKKIYGELKKRYMIQQQKLNELRQEREDLHGKLSKFAADSDDWKEKFETEVKEKEDLRELVAAFKMQNKHLLAQCAELKAQKQAEIRLTRQKSEEEFKIKSKSKKAKSTEEALKCEYPSCLNTNEDAAIKCNSCGKWICETCSEVKIAKLKPIMSSCSTIFFACKSCIEAAQDTGLTVGSDESSTKVVNPQDSNPGTNNPELVSTLKSVLEDTVVQIQTNLGSLIENKLKERLPIPDDAGGESLSPDEGQSYAAKVLKVPEQVRKIIEDSKNDEKVEEGEQERRSRNFVIHGAEEYGTTTEAIKKLDTAYVLDILKHIGISHKPESVTRLGKGASKRRPIKVVMKSKEDKGSVMKNLSKLKGTVDEFGKISITEDYTQTEREKLKQWIEDAKAKSKNDSQYTYKVRGDPKNGLRLIRLSKK